MTNNIKWVKRVVTNDFEFFKEWLKIIISYSPLTEAEAKFVAALLTKRQELKKVILDESILTKFLFSKEVKHEIIKMIEMKDIQQFENMASNLRSKGVIGDGNIINPAYIPPVPADFKEFSIGFRIIKTDDKGQQD